MDLDKIQKLIRLANNNPNEHEANLAAKKACELVGDVKIAFKVSTLLGVLSIERKICLVLAHDDFKALKQQIARPVKDSTNLNYETMYDLIKKARHAANYSPTGRKYGYWGMDDEDKQKAKKAYQQEEAFINECMSCSNYEVTTREKHQKYWTCPGCKEAERRAKEDSDKSYKYEGQSKMGRGPIYRCKECFGQVKIYVAYDDKYTCRCGKSVITKQEWDAKK